MYKGKQVGCIVAAAGLGTRMGGPMPKVLLPIEGKTIIATTVEALSAWGLFDFMVVVMHRDYVVECKNGMPEEVPVVPGGETRQESVARGMEELFHHLPDCDWVVIHDGARPYVTEQVVLRALEGAAISGAAVAAVPVTDTVKVLEPEGLRTLDRSRLYAAQTPQVFSGELIRRAYDQAKETGFVGTDDAQLVEELGIPVQLTEGDKANIKLTTPEDMPLSWASGTGFDVHALVPGRPLILAGVEIPFEKGLLGHSDADVMTHALMDALLGASGLGDIGRWFPDKDPAYKDISSLVLLRKVAKEIRAKGYELGNADLTLIAQEPKIAPYIEMMKSSLSEALGCKREQLNIKGTTTEKLGIPGREEGMAAEAVCMLKKSVAQPRGQGEHP